MDTGGSIEIIHRLQQCNIKLAQIKHIFISHSHTDHILGLIWMFKRIGIMIKQGEIKEKINIYCNEVVEEAIKKVAEYTLSSSSLRALYTKINFVIVKPEEKHEIHGITYTFFDILAKGTKQFGFACRLEGKQFVFLGDEPLNKNLYDRVKNADYVMHEAFCLEKEESIFHAREKNHSTVLSVAKTMESLQVKNLILYHTEESHGNKRKDLYTKEAKQVFTGNIFVPNDLEEIRIENKNRKK